MGWERKDSVSKLRAWQDRCAAVGTACQPCLAGRGRTSTQLPTRPRPCRRQRAYQRAVASRAEPAFPPHLLSPRPQASNGQPQQRQQQQQQQEPAGGSPSGGFRSWLSPRRNKQPASQPPSPVPLLQSPRTEPGTAAPPTWRQPSPNKLWDRGRPAAASAGSEAATGARAANGSAAPSSGGADARERPTWHQLPSQRGTSEAPEETLWQPPDAATLAERFPPTIYLPEEAPPGVWAMRGHAGQGRRSGAMGSARGAVFWLRRGGNVGVRV